MGFIEKCALNHLEHTKVNLMHTFQELMAAQDRQK